MRDQFTKSVQDPRVSLREGTFDATGVEDGTTQVLPVAPRVEAARLGAEILDGDAAELTMPLQGHGPMARRRQYTGALLDIVVEVAVVLALWHYVPWRSFLPFDLPWWVPAGQQTLPPSGLHLRSTLEVELGYKWRDSPRYLCPVLRRRCRPVTILLRGRGGGRRALLDG